MSINLTDVQKIELTAQNQPHSIALANDDVLAVRTKPKQEPDVKAAVEVPSSVAKEQLQPFVACQNIQSEPSSSLDIELESILSEFSVPEGEDLPDDEELMSIFDMCKNNGM